ncbi:type II toxin-antitoxin system RelE/ParE family toxin [Epilithonimonas sp. JDS]|uniref:type II toxin-antitoxin system RelE/ParE family toxin n=1 Tax=Epilithonimonas sp. JDS TaxID=2902797 RepID=UPI001E5CB246|nr:type II toxin-antitoxin system RelE/ParE family toxin [Epilithonimonas sp. JDS]MCD9856425.1 type II toxin-antitoxin system RelE/ParE family toxin [Epilithonimonas sp. JDS]
MKIETTTEFRAKLEKQIQYISLDKPKAAKNFKSAIFSELKKLKEMPYKKQAK